MISHRSKFGQNKESGFDLRVLHRKPMMRSQVFSPQTLPETGGISPLHELLQDSSRVSNPARVVHKYQLAQQSPSHLLHQHLVVNVIQKFITVRISSLGTKPYL